MGTTKRSGWGGILALAIGMALLGADAVRAQATDYLDHDGLTRALRDAVSGSDAATLRSIGASREGRELWMVELGVPGGAPLDERPAVLVVGNLAGDHLVGSALALEIVRHLVDRADDDAVADVLSTTTLYVVPRLNPDGAEARFAGGPLADRRRNAFPHDDDNDGRVDEDGPEDLNGDGLITVMRVPEAGGPYRIDPDDGRLMVEADPAAGHGGTHALHVEGVDSDGDGFLNEDGPGGVDLNRNFQHAYPYWEADAGLYMVSEPESRALMDFAVAHDNIAAILTFGATDNLVTPPNAQGRLADAAILSLEAFAESSNDDVHEVGVVRDPPSPSRFAQNLRGAQPGRDNDPQSGRRPAETVNGDDLPYFEAVSEAYREATGIESVGLHREPEGAFFQVGYFQMGVPSFSTPGWGLPAADGATPEARILAGLDSAGIDAFVPWTPVDHPELGEVEVGGFRPYAVANPPAERVAELGPAHGDFVVALAGMLPRVSIVETGVEALGGGVFQVRATVENAGYLPSALAHGLVCRCVDPVTVQIQLPPERVLTGDPKTAEIDALAGSGSRHTVEWVVEGRTGEEVEIRVRAQKGGSGVATVTLR